jgi:hypothetical protein
MGVLLWQVVVRYLQCMIPSLLLASLGTAITLILVLYLCTYELWHKLTVRSGKFQVKSGTFVSLGPHFILSKCESYRGLVHFCRLITSWTVYVNSLLATCVPFRYFVSCKLTVSCLDLIRENTFVPSRTGQSASRFLRFQLPSIHMILMYKFIIRLYG